MAYAEDILKLRKRINDALEKNVISGEVKDFYEATLLEIMNDAERQRQNCLNQADTLKRQAAIAEGQAAAFSMISSIVYNVINGYVVQAEKREKEDKIIGE